MVATAFHLAPYMSAFIPSRDLYTGGRTLRFRHEEQAVVWRRGLGSADITCVCFEHVVRMQIAMVWEARSSGLELAETPR